MASASDEIADIDLTDPGLTTAATRIQAQFRGHIVRKQAEKTKDEEDVTKRISQLKASAHDDDLDNIDLSDPELNKAATKIQASFRGHKVRKTPGEDEK